MENETRTIRSLEHGATRIEIKIKINQETAITSREKTEMTDSKIEIRRGTVTAIEIGTGNRIIRTASTTIIAQESSLRTLPLQLWFCPLLVLPHWMLPPVYLVHIVIGRYPMDFLLHLGMPQRPRTQSLIS